jgi:hypothetical protein
VVSKRAAPDWIEVVNGGVPVDTDGDTVADDVSTFQTWTNVTVNFSNTVFLQNYSPLYTKAGSITLQYSALGTQDYTFEVFKTNGTLLHTTNGQSVGGGITRQWNFNDLSGNPVNEPSYVFSLTYSPHTVGALSSAAAAQTIKTTNDVDSGVSVGKYVVSFGTWPYNSINTALSNMNAFVSVRVNAAALFHDDIIGSGRENYNPPYVDFSSDPFSIRKNTQTNDILALTNALKDVVTGSWLFDGHIIGDEMIYGMDGYMTVKLHAKDVGRLLGTTWSVAPLSIDYGRRLFSAFLTGCGGVNGDFPLATGTPPGVDQITNLQIKKSAFLGFINVSLSGSTKANWINRIHFDWLDGNDYDTALSLAVAIANSNYPTVRDWKPKVLGYPILEYNGNDSR